MGATTLSDSDTAVYHPPVPSHVIRKAPADQIDHPEHYISHPSGIECIDIAEHFGFSLGNAVKYIWRAGLKSPDALTDLRKARWYLDREIARLAREMR